MTLSVDDLIATAQTRTVEVEVCGRGDLVDRHRQLVAEMDEVAQAAAGDRSISDNIPPRLIELRDEIAAVEVEQAESTLTFSVAAIGALAWNNLLRKHPPRRGIDNGLAYNLETFPAAVVAECVTEPALSSDQAKALYNKLHSAEWNKLFNAAYVVNEQETPHPKLPAAIGNLLQSVLSSTTSDPEG